MPLDSLPITPSAAAAAGPRPLPGAERARVDDRGGAARAVGGLLAAALLATVAQAAVLIAARTHLFADGAWYLLWLLDERRAIDMDASRHYAHLATQWPVVLAIRAGVTDVGALSLLLGGGLYLPGVASLLVCWWVVGSRKEYMLFPLASAAAVTANSSFFVVSESHLLVALFWPLVLLLALRPAWSAATFAAAALLAWPTLRSYQSMVFLGPVLAGLAAWRAWQAWRRGDRWQAAGFAALACYFAAGIAVAAYWIVHTGSPENRNAFLASLRFYRDDLGRRHWLGVLSLGALGLVGAALLVPAGPANWRRPLALVVLLAFAVVCVRAAVGPAIRPLTVAPLLHYRARVLNAYVPPALAALLLLVAWRAARGRGPNRAAWTYAFTVVAALSVAQGVWHALAARRWSQYLDVFRGEITRHQGLVPLGATRLAREEVDGRPVASMNWGWTMPTLSVLLAPGGRVRAIVRDPADEGWQPFDPAHADSLPDLSAYGIRYDAYTAALGRR